MRCVPLILEKILDTQNIAISVIENFLEAFEVGELVQNWTEGRLTQNILDPPQLDFTKILTDEVFAAPFFSYVSHGPDSKCAVFP